MIDHADLTRRLADLIVGYGANVQPGQIVGVTTYTGKEALTREIARAAYERGARWVDVLTFDPWVKRQRLALAPEDSLEDVPQWMIDRLEWLSDEHAARITLNGPSAPTALDGIDPARAGRDLLPYLPNTHKVVDASTTNWCVAPGPTPGWARLVYPELDATRRSTSCGARSPTSAGSTSTTPRRRGATGRAARVDRPDADRATVRRDPAARPRHRPHGRALRVVRLARRRLRHGGRAPALPEHPERGDVHDARSATGRRRRDRDRPLEVSGSVMDGIRVEFAGGRAVRIDAERGAEALRSIAASDDGASLLGELALVDGEGRIGPLGTVFYDTLLDENAASHIALGSAYSMGVEDAADKERINNSRIHVDFMIGSPEIAVDGLTADGTAVPLLRSGAWQV